MYLHRYLPPGHETAEEAGSVVVCLPVHVISGLVDASHVAVRGRCTGMIGTEGFEINDTFRKFNMNDMISLLPVQRSLSERVENSNSKMARSYNFCFNTSIFSRVSVT